MLTLSPRFAFQQLDNSMVTNEQRILEVKVERTYQQLNEISEERVKGSKHAIFLLRSY